MQVSVAESFRSKVKSVDEMGYLFFAMTNDADVYRHRDRLEKGTANTSPLIADK